MSTQGLDGIIEDLKNSIASFSNCVRDFSTALSLATPIIQEVAKIDINNTTNNNYNVPEVGSSSSGDMFGKGFSSMVNRAGKVVDVIEPGAESKDQKNTLKVSGDTGEELIKGNFEGYITSITGMTNSTRDAVVKGLAGVAKIFDDANIDIGADNIKLINKQAMFSAHISGDSGNSESYSENIAGAIKSIGNYSTAGDITRVTDKIGGYASLVGETANQFSQDIQKTHATIGEGLSGMNFEGFEDSILMYTALAKKTYGSVDQTIVRTSVQDFVNGLNSLKLKDLSGEQIQQYQQMGLMDSSGKSKLHVQKGNQSVLKSPEEVEKVFEEAKKLNPDSFEGNMEKVFGQGSQMAISLGQVAPGIGAEDFSGLINNQMFGPGIGKVAESAGLTVPSTKNNPETINFSKSKEKASDYSVNAKIAVLNDSPTAELGALSQNILEMKARLSSGITDTFQSAIAGINKELTKMLELMERHPEVTKFVGVMAAGTLSVGAFGSGVIALQGGLGLLSNGVNAFKDNNGLVGLITGKKKAGGTGGVSGVLDDVAASGGTASVEGSKTKRPNIFKRIFGRNKLSAEAKLAEKYNKPMSLSQLVSSKPPGLDMSQVKNIEIPKTSYFTPDKNIVKKYYNKTFDPGIVKLAEDIKNNVNVGKDINDKNLFSKMKRIVKKSPKVVADAGINDSGKKVGKLAKLGKMTKAGGKIAKTTATNMGKSAVGGLRTLGNNTSLGFKSGAMSGYAKSMAKSIVNGKASTDVGKFYSTPRAMVAGGVKGVLRGGGNLIGTATTQSMNNIAAIGGKIKKVFGPVGNILKTTFSSPLPLLLLVAGIALVVYKNWDKLKPLFMKLKESFMGLIDAVVPLIMGLVSALAPVIQFLWGIFEGIIMFLIESIVPIITNIINVLTKLFKGDLVGAVLESSPVLLVILAPLMLIFTVVGFIIKVVKALWKAIKESEGGQKAIEFLSSRFEILKKIISGVWDFIKWIFGGIVKIIKAVVEFLGGKSVKEDLQGMVDLVDDKEVEFTEQDQKNVEESSKIFEQEEKTIDSTVNSTQNETKFVKISLGKKTKDEVANEMGVADGVDIPANFEMGNGIETTPNVDMSGVQEQIDGGQLGQESSVVLPAKLDLSQTSIEYLLSGLPGMKDGRLPIDALVKFVEVDFSDLFDGLADNTDGKLTISSTKFDFGTVSVEDLLKSVGVSDEKPLSIPCAFSFGEEDNINIVTNIRELQENEGAIPIRSFFDFEDTTFEKILEKINITKDNPMPVPCAFSFAEENNAQLVTDIKAFQEAEAIPIPAKFDYELLTPEQALKNMGITDDTRLPIAAYFNFKDDEKLNIISSIEEIQKGEVIEIDARFKFDTISGAKILEKIGITEQAPLPVPCVFYFGSEDNPDMESNIEALKNHTAIPLKATLDFGTINVDNVLDCIDGIKNREIKIKTAIDMEPIRKELPEHVKFMLEKGAELVSSLCGGIKGADSMTNVEDAITTVNDKIKNSLLTSEEMKNFGANLVSSFAQGMKSKVGEIQGGVDEETEVISDNTEVHSPTRKGPLRTNHLWGGNLAKSFAIGISRNVGLVKAAVADVSNAVDTGINTNSSFENGKTFTESLRNGIVSIKDYVFGGNTNSIYGYGGLNTNINPIQQESSNTNIQMYIYQNENESQEELANRIADIVEKRTKARKERFTPSIPATMTNSRFGFRGGY